MLKNTLLIFLAVVYGSAQALTCDSNLDQRAFYNEADLGYIQAKADSLRYFCQGKESWLKCTGNLEYCYGQNLQIQFPDRAHGKSRYNTEVLKPGDLSGDCKVKSNLLKRNMRSLSPLQSWGPEVRNIQTDSDRICDLVVSKPTILMKLDITSNMYHHFCDFLNLYSSLVLNGSFSNDVHILTWENQLYQSPFAQVMNIFTENPIWNLDSFRGKRVCFKSLMLPLLPRMVRGLYYSTPLSTSCSNSSLFGSFSKFVQDRLKTSIQNKNKPRITIINRTTKYRKILNIKDLVSAMDPARYELNVVEFGADIPFKEQVKITSNTDVLIGIHGAGLTHVMFMPKSSVLFELHNCQDPSCYSNLALLNGIKYLTWTDQSKVRIEGDAKRPKFANFWFDPTEFLRKIDEALTMISEKAVK